jgi:ABC-type multidrug transport system ATPase subunit
LAELEAKSARGATGMVSAKKTTTIRLLTTVPRPTSGRFRVAGVDGTRTRELRRKVAERARCPGI